VGDLSDTQAAANEQAVDSGLFGAMASRFDGQIGAFSYLLFILLYFPCAATIGAIVREAGAPWAAFVAAWTTGVAYITASMFYQIATFANNPTTAGSWIAGFAVVLAAAIVGLRVWSGRDQRQDRVQPGQAKA
jgi:ferrous iron transport protein B